MSDRLFPELAPDASRQEVETAILAIAKELVSQVFGVPVESIPTDRDALIAAFARLLPGVLERLEQSDFAPLADEFRTIAAYVVENFSDVEGTN